MKRRDFIGKSMATAVLGSLALKSFPVENNIVTSEYTSSSDLGFKMLPAPIDGGFKPFIQQGVEYNVWCGSVIKGEDDRFHIFASAIPRRKGSSWVWDSVVVRAVSDKPEGPFEFQEFVFPQRGADLWDGLMTHNPSIHKHEDTYLLFYTGTTFQNRKTETEAWRNKRIGLATSKSVFGPWSRKDEPIIGPRMGCWDGVITSNAAPLVNKDGSILLVYKSTPTGYLLNEQFEFDFRLGVAKSDHFSKPFYRLKETSILSPSLIYPDAWAPGKKLDLEDPFIWKEENGRYHMLVKVFDKIITGDFDEGLHAISNDGVNWEFPENKLGYKRQVLWNNGKVTTQKRLERVQGLIQDGKLTHLYFASVFDSGVNGNVFESGVTANVCIPVNYI